MPGEDEYDEGIAHRRGIPDACIYSDDGWILVVESKVTAKVNLDQLNRHIITIKRKGFKEINLLLINIDKKIKKLPQGAYLKTWSEIYEWGWDFSNKMKSTWANLFTEYFVVKEVNMIKEEKLKHGKITKFTGIPFGKDNPYTYYEAKRLLKLLME